MLKALGNVAPRHLLDTRLNPPEGLRRRVDPQTIPSSARPRVHALRPVPAVQAG
jgi:hypothetical protein